MFRSFDTPPEVASFTDAWIETGTPIGDFAAQLSHLLQMRGLKQQDQKYDDAQRMSHLLQMRGLKRRKKVRLPPLIVASFTDAWIETCYHGDRNYWLRVASFTDAWIETFENAPELGKEFVASFTDAWIETNLTKTVNAYLMSHLLQMRGLKRYSY